MMKRKKLVSTLIGITCLTGVTQASAADIVEGKQLYNQNCVFCHQPDAIGKTGFAPSLANPELLSTASDKFLLGTIRDGRTGTAMMPFAHLGRTKIKNVVAYLRTLSTEPNRSAQIDAQHDAHGDPRLGKAWFDSICSTCHGKNGDGYLSGGTGTAIGNKSFLAKATDGFLRETIKNGRSGTRMLGFSDSTGLANLSDREIDDVIVYLRELAKK